MIANFFREKLFFLLQLLKYNAKLHSSKGGKLPEIKKPKIKDNEQ